VNGDLRYGNTLGSTGGASTNGANPLTGILVGVTKSFDHGLIGIGFEYSTSLIAGGNSLGATDGSKGHWAIPLKLEESF